MKGQKQDHDTMGNLVARIEDVLHEEISAGAFFTGYVKNPECHVPEFARACIDPQRIQEQWNILSEIGGVNSDGGKILEIGSGFGAFVSYVCKHGLQAFGIEIDQQRVNVAHRMLLAEGAKSAFVVQSVGEHIPFADASFDIVYSTNVLEHVLDPEAVLEEAIRVLKPGGLLQFVVPNYGSWWEGHYGILWIPHLSKSAAKMYVRLYGQDPSFIDTLQFITRQRLERILSKYHDCLKVIGWGEDIWEKRMRTLAVPKGASLEKLKTIVRLIHRSGFSKLVIWLGKRLHWETPIILTLRKIQ